MNEIIIFFVLFLFHLKIILEFFAHLLNKAFANDRGLLTSIMSFNDYFVLHTGKVSDTKM